MNATFKQIPQIIELMIEAHKQSPSKQIPYDNKTIEDYLGYWVGDPKSIVLVNSSITACYIMTLAPSWWSNKLVASDVFFYSKAPGAGFRLMKQGQQWVDGFGQSIGGEFISTQNNDPAVDKMYQRLGYKPIGFKYTR